ncbi:Filamin-C [Geodia barretti]|uniref:Filamin-C n=1 Tax=Geodia barretti TaxID=519541 RepID=A0AA35QU68_GEOBA|nr:Filamin-C [Geodia barretti]
MADGGNGGGGAQLADRGWIDVQKKTFRNWVNEKLKDTPCKVEVLEKDFSDGITLIKLLEALSKKKMHKRHNAKPRLDIQKRENVDIALEFMKKIEKIRLENIGVTDIFEHNLKLNLGLVWALIIRYQIATGESGAIESKAVKAKRATAEKLLLGWMKSALPNNGVRNLTTSWNDGVNLSALVDYCQPGLIPDHASLDPERRLENVQRAMELAEEHLQIPQLMHPEDLAVDKPDKLSTMTYLSQFCCPNSVGERTLLEFVRKKLPKQNITNFTTDWVDGRVLGALTDCVSGGAYPEYEQMKPDQELENCTSAMTTAEKLLQISMTCDAEQFANPDLDPMTRTTYLQQFRHAQAVASPAQKLVASGPGITGDSAGKETNFIVRGRIPEWAALSCTVTKADGSDVPTKHHTTSAKAMSYQYTPEVGGRYRVEVKLNDEHIKGSPFNVQHQAPSDADKCTVTGEGMEKGRVGEKLAFSVNCADGGPGELEVEVDSPSGSYVPVDTRESSPRNFDVWFTPAEPGPHSINIRWGGNHVARSPFTTQITDPKKCSASGAGLNMAKLNTPVSFAVKTDKAGQGDLDVRVTAPNGGEVPIETREEGRGNYTCTWVPGNEGMHKIDILYGGAPISGSPFTAECLSPADSSKCTILNAPTGRLRAGQSYNFDVDTLKAGAGDLSGSFTGPSGVKEKCEIFAKSGRVYSVKFRPMEVGPVDVEVLYDGVPIPESPARFSANDPSKCKVNAAALASGSYRTKQPIDFRVAAHFAGGGELTASCKGSKGSDELEVRDQGDQTYLVHYIPKTAGPHAIDIHFDGEQIPDVPIRIHVDSGSDADSVIVAQPAPGRLGKYVVDIPYIYKVNTTGAGDAELTASSYGARTGIKPDVIVINEGSSRHNVTLRASEADEYLVSIMWGEEHVPGSPFKLPIDEKPRAERVRCTSPDFTVNSTAPVSVTADTELAGAGELTAICVGKKVGAVATKVVKTEPDKYSVSFTPIQIDDYSLSVLWSGENVNKSPFRVNLLPPDVTKLAIDGPHVPDNILEPTRLFIDTTGAGNGKLSGSVEGNLHGFSDVQIQEIEPNKFDVSFVPPGPDFYKFDVKWGGHTIPGAPFEINLNPPRAEEVVIVEPPTAMLEAGQAIGICFDTSLAGRGELTAKTTGQQVGEIQTKVSQRSKDKYDVRFAPPEPDIFNVDVLWAGQHVKGSPFTINLLPVDPSKIKVIGPNQLQGNDGPVELIIKTGQAGKGKVTAACIGKQVGDVTVTISETAKDIYQLTFVPPQGDIYTFAVQYGGQKIPGSPFTINTLPPNASAVKVIEPESIELRQPMTYIVDTQYAGNGKLTATCRGEKYGAIEVKPTKKGKGVYEVSFAAHNPDVYKLIIKWSKENVPRSPFKIDLRNPMASKVKVGELHIPDEAGTGEHVWVDVDTSDAGHGKIRGEAVGEKVGAIDCEVETMRRGKKYRVRFPPSQADKYKFSIYYGDSIVPSTPFNINLVPPQPDEVELLDTSIPDQAGGPVTLVFDTRNAGQGTLSAKATGDLIGVVDTAVTEISPDKFQVSFIPKEYDTFNVNVQWAGLPVKGSPFLVDTRPQIFPHNVECGQLAYTSTGKPVTLTADTSRAGKGKLTAQVSGVVSGSVPVHVSSTSSTTHSIQFVPKREDEYSLKVFFVGQQVPGSPFKVDFRPKGPVTEGMVVAPLIPVEECIMVPTQDLHSAPPQEIKRPQPEELTQFIGEPLSVNITVEDKGQQGAPLLATAIGDKTGKAPVSISKNPDGSRDVFFNPDKPDRYKIDVLLGDFPVPNTPIVVNYVSRSDPSKCVIFGLQDIPLVPQVGEPIKFGVDSTQAGEGKLSVTADGPSADDTPSKLDVQTSEKEPGIWHISYTPSAKGCHRIHMQWSKERIPGSPLSFDVGMIGDVQTYPWGSPVAMDINADCRTGDLESYAIQVSNGARHKVKVNKLQKGKFKLSFQPQDPGIYEIHVLLKKKEIPGSPYRIRYNSPPKPETVKVLGLPKRAFVGEPFQFTVDARQAGSGDLVFRGSGPEALNESDLSVVDNKDGTFTAEYVPNAVGEHFFQILWAETAIPGTPFCVLAQDRAPEIENPLEGYPALNVVELEQLVPIRVVGVGKLPSKEFLLAGCMGNKTGEAEVSVEQRKDGSSVVLFTPALPDNYILNVKMNREHIKGSPFTIKAVERGSLAADFVHPDGICHSDVESERPVVLLLPLNAPNSSEIYATTEGPRGLCETSVGKSCDGLQGVKFIPEAPGDYLMTVRKDEEDVSGSPFKITAYSSQPDASKVYILEEDLKLFKKAIPFGKPAKFRIQTAEAGPGTLNITSRGPGKAEVKVFDNKDGTYSCEFLPSVAGKYFLDILWNDLHIKGSPYMLVFKSKKSRLITGLNLEDESFRIGVAHRFKLHCDEVGEGLLELFCRPQSAAKIRLIPIAIANSYQCEIVPQEIGNHEVSVTYNGKHILGSPFNVVFEMRGDASKVRMVESSVENLHGTGDAVTFCISTEGAGNGKLTASVENSITKDVAPVTLTQTEDQRFNVEFFPGDGAEYLLTIKYDEVHITGSPFKLVFGPPPTDANQVTAQGDGLVSCIIGKWAKFRVNTEHAGEGRLAVRVRGVGEDVTCNVSQDPQNELEYEVAYSAKKEGDYFVTVEWAEQEIPGSPFMVHCYHPSDPSIFSIENPQTETMLGEPLKFMVHSGGIPDSGELTVTAQSSQNKNMKGEAVRQLSGDYLCSLNVADPGRYMVHVRWNGNHIRGSPFKAKFLVPPKPQNVKAHGPGLEDGYVGQEGNFMVETGDGGAGTLAVRVHGPKGAFKINMRRHPDNERTILVRYDPTYPGAYKVDITWSEIHVPGSPFTVNIRPQNEKRY